MRNYVLRIKEIRKSKGLTQEKMATFMKITQQSYSDLESEKKIPGINRLVEIANILGVSLDDIVEFKNIHYEYSYELKNKTKQGKK